MALAPIFKCPPVLTLVPSSGIQIIDLGFSVDRSGGFRTNWAFFDQADPLPPRSVEPDDDQAATTYDVSLKMLVETYDGVWMPIPMFREEPGGDVFRGPTNWVRTYLRKLEEPDENGFDYRLLVAFDTDLQPRRDDEAYLAPSEEDATRGAAFSICRSEAVLDWFVQEKWVDRWCLEVVRDMVMRKEAEKRRNPDPVTDERVYEELESRTETIGRYKALVKLLADLDILPKVRVLDCFTEPKPTPILVDFVLDVGNSRTCGMLIETHPDSPAGDISKAAKLELRDLSDPVQVYTDPFESRIEFNRASFGKDDISRDSGRPTAFTWPTVVRIGPEAQRLAGRRRGSEGATGLSSSPKRYLWDDDPRRDSWRFNGPTIDGEVAPMATGVAFTTLVNDLGEPLHGLPESVSEFDQRRFPSFKALYARRNLMSFALTEVFLQTIVMMNSAAHRRRESNAELPRCLRRIIMTMPTALPLAERQILRKQAESARDLAYLCLGQTNPGEDGSAYLDALDREGLLPEIKIDWDEASATQAVFLYGQIAEAYSGDAGAFFRRSRLPFNRNSELGDDFRLATLDIGGGTTDLVVTSYKAEGRGAHVTLFPTQEFREGFNVAGDDIVFRVIRDHVLAPIGEAMERAGVDRQRVRSLSGGLFGGDRAGMSVEHKHYRQQFAIHVGVPAALHLIAEYEKWDAVSGPTDGETIRLEDLLGGTEAMSGAAQSAVAHVNRTVRDEGTGIGFDLAQVELPATFREIDRTVRSVVQDLLRACAEIVYRARADLLILSGRPSRMPAVGATLTECMALPPHRVIPLHSYEVGAWYPFRDHALRISDPKTTAAVGAMICLLGEGRLRNFNFRSDRLKPRSTARFFGLLDKYNRLEEQNVYFRDLDLEDEDYELPPDTPIEFRGPMSLGFRQFDADWWPGTRLYDLDFASPSVAPELNPWLPLKVTLGRVKARARGDIVDAFTIDGIEDVKERRVERAKLKLRLQTIDNPEGYWLDTGILLTDR